MELLAISATKATLEFIDKGGIFMYPLCLCSIAGLTAVGFKAMSLAVSRTVPDSLARGMVTIDSVDSDAVVRELKKGDSALARLGAVALRHHGKSAEDITRAVESSAREEVVKMHDGISLLDVVITVAPLLGLLGTASGLVTIFQGLGETTDHLAIARGIAEALNTTIFGLAIAVPCVIAHSYFTRRIERLTARMESVLADFVSACSHQTPPAH
jgi:biopolymer transport protein ExbB